jgi:hypothetical protein
MFTGPLIDHCTPSRCVRCADLDICLTPKVERSQKVNDVAFDENSTGWMAVQKAIAESAKRMATLPPRAECDVEQCYACNAHLFCFQGTTLEAEYEQAMLEILKERGHDNGQSIRVGTQKYSAFIARIQRLHPR